ncbi:MAG: prepilin-type N-terminal cleavage/methylation domain-containing protein [Deltaproteobacteria bacterium]|nr:prepilin-type N-terminal cleavage/methylation domain-containing protein [Deltaproteobacteria bacterium]
MQKLRCWSNWRSLVKLATANQNGFTLIELLVAITLLLIGMFSVITMQITAIKSNSIANKLSTATALAQESMDDIMAWSISDPSLNTSTANAVYDLNGTNVSGTDLTVSGAGIFRATYTTTINTPVVGVTRIVVSIFRVTNGVSETTPYVSFTSYKRTT